MVFILHNAFPNVHNHKSVQSGSVVDSTAEFRIIYQVHFVSLPHLVCFGLLVCLVQLGFLLQLARLGQLFCLALVSSSKVYSFFSVGLSMVANMPPISVSNKGPLPKGRRSCTDLAFITLLEFQKKVTLILLDPI